MTNPATFDFRPSLTRAPASRTAAGAWLSAAVILAMSLLVGCAGSGQRNPPASPTGTLAAPSSEPSPTASLTPIPSVLLIVGSPGDEQPVIAERLLSIVSTMAASEGLSIGQSDDLTNIPAQSVASVITFDGGSVPEIGSRFPGKPILLVTVGPHESGGQPVFSLYFPEMALERQAMLAGYSAALITRDWRVAALTSPAEEPLRESILQGATYMCGLCRPALPPYAGYPLSFQLDTGAGSGQLEATAAEMNLMGVETAVLGPSLLQVDIVQTLGEHGIRTIGMGSVVGAAPDIWAASIQYSFESALAEIWPAFISGGAPLTSVIPLRIEERNPELFTDARLRLAERTADEIGAGGISPIP